MKFNIIENLTPERVNLEKILLDPNNPRFADLELNSSRVSESRFAEEGIQDNTYRKMKQNFDIEVLTNTIKELGFLPIDKIILRAWNNTDKYVVVEGNRRITALKSLLEQYKNGAIDLTPEQIDNYTNLEVLILQTDDENSLLNTLIPGLRHVSGIKDWGAYQKAKLLHQLREVEGFSPQEAAEAIGLSIQKANNLYRSYKVFMQMYEDEEYGDAIETKMFSFAEETIKKRILKEWLKWDDKAKEILDKENLTTLLSLFICKEDDDEPKLTGAIQIRDFAKLIEANDKKILDYFYSKEGTLTSALARLETTRTSAEWRDELSGSISTLENLSHETLQNISEEDLCLLKILKFKIDMTLNNIQKLRS